MRHTLGLLVSAPLLATGLAAQGTLQGQGSPAPAGNRPNVLLIVADDVGVDRVAAYREHPQPGRTPVIDRIAAQGVLFRNVWSNPACSPTRATILTGNYGMRTGIGTVVSPTNGGAFELSDEEVTLADVLGRTHATAAVGKWHLGLEAISGLTHPMMLGFDQHLGPMGNLPLNNGYYSFNKNVNGSLVLSQRYATSDEVDDALAIIRNERRPWFVWLAFSTSGAPFHKPPPELHSFVLPSSIQTSIPVHVKAAIESMDSEIGRLLDGIPPAVLENTIVVFVGDNGTDARATTTPFLANQSKETLFEGGINVPLIIQGPGIAKGHECDALVNTTDLFATLVELAGVADPTPRDSVSLVPYLRDPSRPSLRSWVYAEHRAPNGFGPYQVWRRAVQDGRFKLIRIRVAGVPKPLDLLYDLRVDPYEEANLLAEAALSREALTAYTRLHRTLEITLSPHRPRSGSSATSF